MPYRYDAAADRYRNTSTGRYVTRTDALAYVEQSLDSGRDVVSQFSILVGQGDISAADWRSRMQAELKGEYIRQYLLGRGGLGSMTAEDWGSIGGLLGKQYKYLDSFYADIKAGKLSEAQIVARAQLYTNSARDAYERGHRRAALGGGFTQVRWMLGDSEHCSDCEGLAAQGWMPIDELPTTPGAGQTACKVNCKCSLEYQA